MDAGQRHRRRSSAHARAFTIRDTLAVVTAVCLLLLLVGILMPAYSGGPRFSPQLKDASQVRGVMQAMVTWAGDNKSNYPLPSLIDTANATVPDLGRAKDTTANIVSMLVYNGGVSPEICVSPREANPAIKICESYEFERPKAAAAPASALWDPAFSMDFTNGGVGHCSYAFLQPSGQLPDPSAGRPERTGRLRMWQDTYSTTEAVVSNRGPEIASVVVKGDGSQPGHYRVSLRNTSSKSLRINGNGGKWAGNVAFNDGHVEFINGLGPPHSAKESWPTYLNGTRLDTLFYDEPDDPDHANAFLGIFTTAGETPEDFKAIWD